MSNLSRPVAHFDDTGAQHSLRQTFIAAAFISVAAMLALTLAGATHVFGTRECKLQPLPFLLATDGKATAVSKGGASCLIVAQRGGGHIEALDIATPPGNGRIVRRGRTGLLYYPDPNFKGADSFELRLVRRTGTQPTVTSAILMTVNVE